jgi:uncharacterized membrane protein YeaQ/YmgE (transglycosylase-associated protein family)
MPDLRAYRSCADRPYPEGVLLALLVVLVVLFVVLPIIGATLMSILQALVVGLILGLIARAIAPGRGRLGLFETALVGIAGGLIGRIVARVLLDHQGGHRFAELLLEVGASVVVVMVVRNGRRGIRA